MPIGTTATVTKYDVTLDVTVQEVLTGADVWTIAEKVGANDTTAEGCEIIVIKTKAKIISGADDEPFSLSYIDFEFFSSDGVDLKNIFIYIPEDKTLTAKLFTDAEKEGYSSHQIKSGDIASVFQFGDTWFALTE